MLTVPIQIEGLRQLLHHRAGSNQVQVDEVGFTVAHEIFVRHVTPTEDGHCVVGHEQLVVHAAVDGHEFVARPQQPGEPVAVARRQRIEQPDLDAGVRRQPRQQRIGRRRVQVIHQQPHPYAAPRRVSQRAQELHACGVGMQVVILHVERALRPGGQRDAANKRMTTDRQEAEAGAPKRRAVGRDPAKSGGLGVIERDGVFDRASRRQGTAGRQPQRKQRRHESRKACARA